MAILVTGGAGYIGSVTVALLRRQGDDVVILDNLCRGHRGAIPADVPFYEGSTGDQDLVRRICREHEVTACVHFAAFIEVGESVNEPLRYYRNNVCQSLGLLEALVAEGVGCFVFSSTAAVYGEPQRVPIPEPHPTKPHNPYGASKLTVEDVLAATAKAHDFRYAALRYFNACGALPDRGEAHNPESHLIPLVLQVALGQREKIFIFGDDYDTPDGTCIRDYIHVEDLAEAHLRALSYLQAGGEPLACNLGTGSGHSVREVIETAREVTGHEIPAEIAPRRPGDPSRLVADPSLAHSRLDWAPKRPELREMVASAWTWHREHPRGYTQ